MGYQPIHGDTIVTCHYYYTIITTTSSGSLLTSSTFTLTVSTSPMTLSATRSIPLMFDQVMDYRLDKVTRDRVLAFVTIFSVLSTIHPSPLPDLPTSSQSKTHSSDPPAIVKLQEEAIVNQTKEVVIE